MPRIASVILCLTVILMFAQPVSSRTLGKVEKTCPLCNKTFTATVDRSGTQSGMRLDLKPLGPTGAPWKIPVCPHCHFVLYKDDYSKEEIEKYKKLVATEEYLEIAKNYSSHFMLAKIFEHGGEEALSIAHMFIRASWQLEGSTEKCSEALEAALKNFNVYLKESPKDEDERITAELVAGECERRLKLFKKAKLRFERLKGLSEFQKEPLLGLIKYQLELVEKKDSDPHEIQ